MYAGNMANVGQIGDKYGQMDQVDVAGSPGPTGRHRPVPPRRCLAPLGAHLTPCHISDPWELLLSQWKASIQVGLIKGQDLFMVDSWAHCHTLGALHQLTNRLAWQNSPCADFTTTIEEQLAPLDAKVVHPRAGRCRPVATDLPATYKYPHVSLHYN